MMQAEHQDTKQLKQASNYQSSIQQGNGQTKWSLLEAIWTQWHSTKNQMNKITHENQQANMPTTNASVQEASKINTAIMDQWIKFKTSQKLGHKHPYTRVQVKDGVIRSKSF